MAITGAHMLLYTTEPEALRAMLRDVFGWKYVDAGHGWLIFALPPAEMGVHPAEGPTYQSGVRHQISLMCDDIRTTIAELRGKGVAIKGEPEDEGFGITVTPNPSSSGSPLISTPFPRSSVMVFLMSSHIRLI